MSRIALSAVFVLLAALPAGAAERVALVIGNSGYATLAPLANPSRDAGAVAARLRSEGFTVMEHRDLKRAEFLDAVEEFRTISRGAELAVVYYAGHGMEVSGRDVVAPIDMEVACEPRAVRRAVGLDDLFEAAGGALNRVVLLDACRSDPFPMCPSRGTQASGFRGLSRVSGEGSTLIASATLSGELASDGEPGAHSPFTAALLARFDAGRTVPIRDLLDQVAEDVRLATGGAQVPEVTTRGGAPRLCLSEAGCSEEPLTRVVLATPPKTIVPISKRPPGTRFRDCDDCPEMIVLPPGAVELGSPPDEAGRDAGEGPRLSVRIDRPLAVSRTEVTFDAWEVCALDGHCPRIDRDAGWGQGKRPAIYLSHADALAYVGWLSAVTGERYRLPSEAEWEYAARGGTTTAFSTGAALPAEAANVDQSLSGDIATVGAYEGRTLEVGSFPPNPFGIFDMHGNVAEWTADCWNGDHAGSPADGSPRGGDCTRRVVKGGAWYFEPAAARVAARSSQPADRRLNVIGLRVVRDMAE